MNEKWLFPKVKIPLLPSIPRYVQRLVPLNNPCNPLDCPAYASGYCEYDFATGQIMPMDPNCPLLKEEEHLRIHIVIKHIIRIKTHAAIREQ